jgi:hypothetical protein
MRVGIVIPAQRGAGNAPRQKQAISIRNGAATSLALGRSLFVDQLSEIRHTDKPGRLLRPELNARQGSRRMAALRLASEGVSPKYPAIRFDHLEAKQSEVGDQA